MKIVKIVMVVAMSIAVNMATAAGAGVFGKVFLEAIEVAAKKSGKILTATANKQAVKKLSSLTAKYGDDIILIVKKGGLEVLEQGAKHGDDFWRLCKEVPEASRVMALRADELMPLARRIGSDVLKVEAHAPGMTARIVSEMGDNGVRHLAKNPQDCTKLFGFAAKADTPATKKLLFSTYSKSKNPSTFLKKLDRTVILSGGLTASMIIGTYKTTDGLKAALKNPDVAKHFISTSFGRFTFWLSMCLVFIVVVYTLPGLSRGVPLFAEAYVKAKTIFKGQRQG